MGIAKLRVENLNVAYGNIKALKAVTITLDEGEIVTLIGSNGAGKTTLVKCISGLIRPASGAIYFENQRIDGLEPHKIVRLGIVQIPEGRRVFHNLTVQGNLHLGALTSMRKYKETLVRILDLFPVLAERRNQVAGTLSGGERQLLAIARGLMANPRILIFDEPSLGLSPYWVGQVKNIIDSSKKMGISQLIIEQNAELALNTAERGYVLELGKVSLEGSTKDLREDERVFKAYLGLD